MPRLFLSLLLAFSMAGCGYTTGSLLPAKYRRIAIEPFENRITNLNADTDNLYVPGVETKVRTAVIDRFLFDGNLKISDPDKADLIMTGSLVNIGQDTLRQDVNQNVLEYRIRIVVALTLKDAATGEVLWTEPSFTGETTYFLTGVQAISQAAALEAAMTDLGDRIVDRTVESW